MAFLRRGQLVRAPLLNDLSCLMDGLALITNCLWHYLQFTKLLAAFHLPSVVNHLPVVQGEQQERGWTAGPGDQVFEKQGYAGDARGSRCRWAGLLFSHTCKPELWDYPFFCLPIVIHPGGAFQELASQSLHGSAPTKQLIALLLWFLFRSLSINILKTLTRVNAEHLKSASVLQD